VESKGDATQGLWPLDFAQGLPHRPTRGAVNHVGFTAMHPTWYMADKTTFLLGRFFGRVIT